MDAPLPDESSPESSQSALSKREQEVLDELRNGGRVATIANKLSISPTTVRNHLQRIFWKLGVHSQAELVEHVRRHPETLSDVDAEARYWQANQSIAPYPSPTRAARSGLHALRSGPEATRPARKSAVNASPKWKCGEVRPRNGS